MPAHGPEGIEERVTERGRELLAVRQRVRVTGTVQGVGFRPFVYRQATELGLSGFVCNDDAGVLIEIEGDPEAIAAMCTALLESPPPLARVSSVEATTIAAEGFHGLFRILESTSAGTPTAPVSIDVSTCELCLAEVNDSSDRRARYPFTNCTNCGPRYTIVISVPYDRSATTMQSFAMCDLCQAEYDDPASRRFHAQPNSCPDCGPRLRYTKPDGTVLAESDAALRHAAESLVAGEVIAMKGLGGYHIAVDATSEAAVSLLRRRKSRDEKPFAVMVTSPAMASDLCTLNEVALAALCSVRRPIVLATRRAGCETFLAEGVAPRLPELGLMLPYTPLHHLLMAEVRRPLVMTSGNLTDDPIAFLDDEALERLAPLVDGVLAHDRPIHIRCDDSVVRQVGHRVQAVRRSRGYAPEPLRLPGSALRQVLSVGAELKNTISVAKGREVVSSHHIGDLEHLATYESFLQATTHLCELFGIEPDVIVHDLHPEYLSTKFALDRDVDTRAVQHHHAHVASCLVEHGRIDPVVGVVFDGLGMGDDGVFWGGEFLVADFEGFERAGHLVAVPMPGGSAAIKEPWRMALSFLATTLGVTTAATLGPSLDGRWRAVLSLVERREGVPATTSVGRLFDAIAAMLGIRLKVTYEGQAAVELEAAAVKVADADAPTYPIEVSRHGETRLLDVAPLIAAIVAEIHAGTDMPVIAAGFHKSLGLGAARLAAEVAHAYGISTVALSGGVFQNARLSQVMQADLERQGLEVLVHGQVPPNDGGISIGQAAIGALAKSPAC